MHPRPGDAKSPQCECVEIWDLASHSSKSISLGLFQYSPIQFCFCLPKSGGGAGVMAVVLALSPFCWWGSASASASAITIPHPPRLHSLQTERRLQDLETDARHGPLLSPRRTCNQQPPKHTGWSTQ